MAEKYNKKISVRIVMSARYRCESGFQKIRILRRYNATIKIPYLTRVCGVSTLRRN